MNTTKRSFWSRPRGPLLLGAAACVACCTAPLAAIVIGAGAASTIAAIAEPLAGLLLGVGALLGIGLYVRRRRARAASACAVDRSCGCGPTADRTLYSSPEPIATAPVACTYDLSNRKVVQAGIDLYRSVFTHLLSSTRTDRGFTWTFRRDSSIEAKLQQLAEGEHACCSFMRFEVTTAADIVVWEVSADAHAQSFVDEYFRLPERLREETRSGHDVAHVKRAAEGSGLVFTSDQPR